MPRIGLLSDSHGRASTTLSAVEALLASDAERLIHLGDVGSVEVIDALLSAGPDGEMIPAHLVFGNTDWDLHDLSSYARELGVNVDHPAGRLDLPNGQLAYCHGHENEPMERALRDGVRYLCHGHTHRQTDKTHGTTRIINPGALFRAAAYTCAVLDTETDDLTVLEI